MTRPHIDLRGALHEPTIKADTRRTALIAGAVNRLGEAMLNRLVREYRHTWVLTSKPIVSSTTHCSHILLPSHAPDQSQLDHEKLAHLHLPKVDDVYCCVGPPGLANARDEGLHAISEADILPFAHVVASAKASRFCLIQTALPSVQMMRHTPLSASELLRQLAELPFTQVTEIHPSMFRQQPVEGGWIKRFQALYLDQFRYMLPNSVAPLTSERIAEACVLTMHDLTPGIRVLDTGDLRRVLGIK
ncbi:hypothetical protein [Andreprevotia chitinilytica]|uniref:hypothetical protein n=1 Tax=Andreprevotia chitinilytica TaxID=396808 RepID=UPI0005500C3B|nr:hypothetical protein [Andreprevotia chitinilytica]